MTATAGTRSDPSATIRSSAHAAKSDARSRRCRGVVASAGAQSLNGDGSDESAWNLMGLSRASAGASDGDRRGAVCGGPPSRYQVSASVASACGGCDGRHVAFFTVGAPVMVSIPQDPQGAECPVEPFGDNPSRTVTWTSDCGQAFARHLLTSGGPVLLLLGVTAGATLRSSRQSRSQSSGTPVAAS